MTFQSILQRYRSESYSESDKGTRFEELIARYLRTDPTYARQLERVWMWSEFPYRDDLGGRDSGIDLVARTSDGEWWAIQCKCYAEGHTVSKDDMDTFLSTSGRRFRDADGIGRQFSQRMIVATTDDWSGNALEVTRGQTIPVTILGLSILESAPVDWDAIEEGVHGRGARTAPYELRPHQREALEKALEHYRDHDRGKMIMACGTGKTFTSLRIAEAILRRDAPAGKGCVLFLAPSISLVGQTLREWMRNAEIPMTPICVCSDVTVTRSRVQDDVGERVEDLGMPATTDPGRIVSRYRMSEDTVVVFSTYQSIDAVIGAQRDGLPEFDLIVCDEAHRTTGVIKDRETEGAFTKVHDNGTVRGKKRLYMTATPRLYGDKGKADAKKAAVELCSMDDASKYGEEFYGISFGRAVELGLLSDYKVMILTTTATDVPEALRRHWTNGGKEIDVDTRCKIWGCLNALAKNVAYDTTLKNTDPSPMRSAVSFCRSIRVSEEITRLFNDMATDPLSPKRVVMRHIDGSMNAMRRDELLRWLKEGSEECHVLSNVRCLSEGVDVPALDAVMFMDSKGSMVDVVQSVGRVMRRAPGKMYGYIVIPIVVPEDTDPESALDDNERYKVVWQVLRALRSHDERLEAEINTFNYTKDGGGSDRHIVIGMLGYDTDGEPPVPLGNQWTLDDFNGALMARLVLKVGDRDYIENWAKRVAEITPKLTEQLTRIYQHEERGYKQYRRPFERYLKGLRECVNNNVSESQAIDMLAQQIITKPIFEELFAKDGFALRNPVSQTIDGMLRAIDAKDGLRDLQEDLDEFHRTVEITLAGIDTTEGKQKVITALYEKFFKNAFPKDQAINGVVYTPQEIVDFIIHSCAEVLKQEFGVDINDEGVNILDPFTGTGTFIARLMESGLITKDNLERKYRHELFANEITLLAYYIATVNIENTYARVSGSEEYVPFENILLTDTFNIEEICKSTTQQTTLSDEEEPFKQNRERIRREHDTQITVIMGNPPYGSRQKSANDDAKKRNYLSGIDQRIDDTYLDESLFSSKVNNFNAVYDNYVRAFRWATDRIGDADGVISFVTPSGWLTTTAFEGFRKTIESEFSSIYVFNLRGDQNGSNWRLEGEKVFGEGSKVGIGITLLVRKKGHSGNATIRYYAVPDGLKRQEKLNLLVNDASFPRMESSKQMTVLRTKDNGDWIVQRNDTFQNLIPLAGDTNRKFEKHNERTVFVGYSLGYTTNRDAWSYNFSKRDEVENISKMIDEYNRQLQQGNIEYNPGNIKWASALELLFKRKTKLQFQEGSLVVANYRPFCKLFFYT